LLLRAAGWSPLADWTDDKGLFSDLLCEANGGAVRFLTP
jgi:hypothetical protein